MSRWIRTAVVVVSVVVGAGACGGGSSTGSQSTPTPSSPTSTAANAALTAQQARTLAAAAILKTADLPGYKAKPATHTAQDVTTETVEGRCLGAPHPQYRARNFGTAFTKGDVEVDSAADVATSVAEANRELHALTGSKAPGCLRKALAGALAASGAEVRAFSAKLVPVKIADADAAFAYRLSIQAAMGGHTVKLVGYEVGTLVGPVEVDVQVTGTDPLPLTLSQAEHLAQIATTRARSAQQTVGASG